MDTEIKSSLLRRERTLPPLAYRIRDAATALGIGRSTLYELIKDGEIAIVKVGSRTLITATELAGFLDRGAGGVDALDQSSGFDG